MKCYLCGREVPRTVQNGLCPDCYHAEEELKLRRQTAEDRRRQMAEDRRREDERRNEQERQRQREYEERRRMEWERAQAEEAECRRRAQEEARRQEAEKQRLIEAEREEAWRQTQEAQRQAEAEQVRQDQQLHRQAVEARRQREVEEERLSNSKRWYGHEWVDKILVNPGVAKHLDWDDWGKLTGSDWVRLLLKRPRFAEDCSRDDVMGWFAFNGRNWAVLLAERPEFAAACSQEDVDGWSRLTPEDWISLLTAQPQFVGECRNWKEFKVAHILRILSVDLSIANHIDKAYWSMLPPADYELLVSAYPELLDVGVSRRELFSYGKLDGSTGRRIETIKRHWETGVLAEQRCPQCGKEIVPGQVFCGYCGYLLKVTQKDPLGMSIGTPVRSGQSKHLRTPSGLDFELVYCSPGEFVMGGAIYGLSSWKWAEEHRVRLTRGFWIGKYPVTQAQWCRLMAENPSRFTGGMRPVENVTWDAAQEFLVRVGAGARLPTEAEWEYACRAGTDLRFSWGMSLNGDMTRCDGTMPCGGLDRGEQAKETSRVDVGLPNRWGIYDFHGNVPEWCSDWYAEYPSADVVDPVGASTGTHRVVRGGGWDRSAVSCAAMARSFELPSATGIGLRVVFPD